MRKIFILFKYLLNLIRVRCRESFLWAKEKGMIIGDGTYIHPTAMFAYPQKIKIGKGCYIGAFCNIRALDEDIIIGDYCLIAQFVSIIGANHKIDQPRITDKVEDHVSKKIVIGDNVWIGANVVILPGVTIGDGAVVGAGSVVTQDIPPYYISAGVPAKVIRKRQLD